MRIFVDASTLSPTVGGISRYLTALLTPMQQQSSVRTEWVLCGRGDALREHAKHTGAEVRIDHLPPDFGRILSLFTTLPYWTQRDCPDVFWGPAHRLPIGLPASTRRVVTVHDLCWLLAPQTMRSSTRMLDSLLMPRAIRSADAVIAVSSSTLDALLEHFPTVSEKLHLIHEGASTLPPPMPVEAIVQWGISAPYVLFVGTLEPRKNLPRLLEAFARMRKAHAGSAVQSAQLVVVGGSGWGDDNLSTEIQRLGLSHCVRILGRVSDVHLSTLYRHAVCLALPSLYEGFGLPLVEAMAQGTPVLTSTTSAMPEVAGAAGCLVDPLDVDSIAIGLSKMLSNPIYRNQLAANSKLQAARFSWDRAATETLEILTQNCQFTK